MWGVMRQTNTQVLNCMDKEMLPKLRMAIADTDDVNAMIDPSKNLLIIYRGLYARYNYEELQFIVGHEIAHVKLNHYQTRLATSLGTSAVMNIANVFLPGVGYLNHVVNPLVVRGFGRAQELDADKLSCESLNRCYALKPEVCITALEKLKDYAATKGITEESRIGLWDTHPGLTERIEAIKKKFEEGKADEEAAGEK